MPDARSKQKPAGAEQRLDHASVGCARARSHRCEPEVLRGTNFIEAMVDQERGFFEDEGLLLDLRGGQGGGPVIQALVGSSLEIGRTGPLTLIPAIVNQGIGLVNTATVQHLSPFEIASLPEYPILTPEEMEGRTIGVVSADGGTENILDLMLTGAGVPLEPVSRPAVGVGFAPYELARSGEVDAWVGQTTARALIEREQGIDLPYVNPDEFIELPSSSYVIPSGAAAPDGDVAVRFFAGSLRGHEFLMDESGHEQAVEDLQVYNPDIDMEPTLFELPLLMESWSFGGDDRLLELDEARWQGASDGLVVAGFIDREASVDELTDPTHLDVVKGR